MPISESLRQLESAISDMEIAVEKAQIMAADLLDDYFSMSESASICYYHDRAGLFNSISLDYIVEMRKLLEAARENVNIEWEAARTQDSKTKSPQSSNE